MPHRAALWSSLAVLAVLVPARASAKPFDLIFADSIEVVAGPGVTGFSNGNNIAAIANRGPGNITNADLSSATFSVTTSNPLVQVFATKDNTGLVTPVLPLEVVGTMPPGSPLLAKVLPDEAARNVYPIGLFWLGVDFPVGFNGVVVANIQMTMGGDVAYYFTLLHIAQGTNPTFDVIHADRVRSQPAPVAARTSTWGAIKKLYR